MTLEANDDLNDTILEAEASILRISQELGRMKSAAELLDETGKRSLKLQDAVESLVTEINTLVKLSGRVIEALNASDIRELLTEVQTALAHRMDGLRTELLENSKSDAERVGGETQAALIEHLDNLETEISAKSESAAGRVGAELRGALIQRLDILEKKIAADTKTTTEQIGAELRGALVQRMDSLENDLRTNTVASKEEVRDNIKAANADILKRQTKLDSQVAEVRELAIKILNRKGIYF